MRRLPLIVSITIAAATLAALPVATASPDVTFTRDV